MKRVLIGLIVGLLIGMLATLYFVGGRPLMGKLPGTALRPPDASAGTSGTVSVAIDEKFFDALLGTIFQQLGPPQLKLSQLGSSPFQTAAFQAACDNVVVLNQESGNVKTSVRFTGGKIVAPLAFNGSYNIVGKCVQFKGVARATVDLSFDQSKQTVFGALNVEEVNLENVSPLVSALVTAFVRQTIAAQVNPFEVLKVSQLALSLPIKQANGSLKATVKDVRAEVQEGALRLVLSYDFSGEKNSG